MKLQTPFHRHSRAGGNPVKIRFGMMKLKPHKHQLSTKQNKLSAKPVWIPACVGMTGLELLKMNK